MRRPGSSSGGGNGSVSHESTTRMYDGVAGMYIEIQA